MDKKRFVYYATGLGYRIHCRSISNVCNNDIVIGGRMTKKYLTFKDDLPEIVSIFRKIIDESNQEFEIMEYPDGTWTMVHHTLDTDSSVPIAELIIT